jgi:hypothetical protein
VTYLNFPECVIQTPVYLTRIGVDSLDNLCDQNNPCQTFTFIFSNLDVFANPQFSLFEGIYQIQPMIPIGESNVMITPRLSGTSSYYYACILFEQVSYIESQPLFNLGSGNLNVNNMYILHNSYSGGVFFYVEGVGILSIEKCNIYGSGSPERQSVCKYSLIESNENCTIIIAIQILIVRN